MNPMADSTLVALIHQLSWWPTRAADSFWEWALGAAMLLAILAVVHFVISRIVRWVLPAGGQAHTIAKRVSAPVLVILVGATMLYWLSQSALIPETRAPIAHFARIVVICGFGFLFVRMIWVAADTLSARLPSSSLVDVRYRRAQTQLSVMRRLATMSVSLITAGVVLWTFPEVRALGTSILASAGLIGVLAGVAARSTFGNLVAGLQIAFAEPIQLDDAVVVEGDYGTIEEITLTYVVVRAWDQRRLVIPSAWFVENRFENWTKSSAELTGSAYFYLDVAADVAAFRAEALRAIASFEEWNGDISGVHVVDITEQALQIRVVASAADAGTTFELRAKIREHMLGWLAENRPRDFVRVRGDLGAEESLNAPDDHGPSTAPDPAAPQDSTES